MNGVEGERGEGVQGRALDGDAQGDEGVVDCAAAVTGGGGEVGTGDFEVGEVDEFGEGGNEGGDVCGCVEERGVLFDEEVLHFPGSVLGCLVFCWSVLRILDLWFVVELLFLTSHWVYDWWQESVWAVGHVEGECLDMVTYP